MSDAPELDGEWAYIACDSGPVGYYPRRHVSPDDQRPPTSIRGSGGSMPFSEADFTRDAARLVAEGDRVPAQRDARLRQVAAEVAELEGISVDEAEVRLHRVLDEPVRKRA